MFRALEVHLQRKLNDSVVRKRSNVARLCTNRLANSAKCGIGEGHVRIGQLWVVKDVEEFASELEVNILVRRNWREGL